MYTKPLILNSDIMAHFITAFLSTSSLSPKYPSISPYYEDLAPFYGKLPPALFTCGTDDPLLDDTLSMGVKWNVSGGNGVIKIYPGAAHGFIGFAREQMGIAGEAMDDTVEFIKDCLERV